MSTQQEAKTALTCQHLGVVPEPSVGTYVVRPDDEVPTVAEFFGSWFSRSPRHHTIKRCLRGPYSALSVKQFIPMFEEVAEHHLSALPWEGDLLHQYLIPFGMETTAAMLEVPRDLWPQLDTSVRIMSSFLKKRHAFTGGEIRGMEACIRFLRRVVDRLFALPSPGPVVGALREIAGGDNAGMWLAVTTVGQLLAAGVEPMTTGAAVACRELFGRGTHVDEVRDGRIAIEDVVEEAIRLDPPFLYVHRWAQHHCGCLGPEIEAGSHVVIDVRAVNRDSSVLDAPDSFDPTRPHHLNLTFGRGSHYCLGIASGRLQMAVALRALLGEVPHIEVNLTTVDVRDEGIVIVARKLPFHRVTTS